MNTDNLTDAEINLRLAEALGVDLTARTDGQKADALVDAGIATNYATAKWLMGSKCLSDADHEAFEEAFAAYRRTPPNWVGSLELAFELGEEMRKHDLQGVFLLNLGRVQDYTYDRFAQVQATAHQRALAALRTLEEAKDDR